MDDDDGREPGDTDGLAAAMRAWRRRHPHATLTEIEQEVDRQWRGVRADLVATLAQTDGAPAGRCSVCGGVLTRRGARARTLRTDGDQPLVLGRAYLTCSVCGHGLFPPG